MDAAEKKRKIIIGSALIATLIAASLVEDEEMVIDVPETLQPVKAVQERGRKHAPDLAQQLDVSKLGQRKFSPLAGEIFLSTNWAPKQPLIDPEEQEFKMVQPVRALAPPPAPTAPPLQFKYAGKAIEDNQTWVFLVQAGENFITKVGEKINPQYRLDAVNDDTVTVTYLPLNVKQTLTINNKIAGTFR